MGLAVDSLVYALLWYVPGLFVGLAELEIENLGEDFWAQNLNTKIIPLPCISKDPGDAGKTFTTYHLFFFGALLATLLSGFLTAAVSSAGNGFPDIAGVFLIVLSSFVMINVVEDNTWYLYRLSWPEENSGKHRGFTGPQRVVRYSVSTLLAFGLFCAGQCGRTGDCSVAVPLFWISVGYYISFVVVLDCFILGYPYKWARNPEKKPRSGGSAWLLGPKMDTRRILAL